MTGSLCYSRLISQGVAAQLTLQPQNPQTTVIPLPGYRVTLRS